MTTTRKCRCVAKCNKELEKIGMSLDSRTSIDFSAKKVSELSPLIALVWIDPKKRKKLQPMVCSYCPFCGRKK